VGAGPYVDARGQTWIWESLGYHDYGPVAGAASLGRLSWRLGTVVALHDETATARTITFEIPDWPGHLAGQHVDVRLTASVLPIACSNWRFGESEKFMKYIVGMLFVLGALLVLVNGCAPWAS